MADDHLRGRGVDGDDDALERIRFLGASGGGRGLRGLGPAAAGRAVKGRGDGERRGGEDARLTIRGPCAKTSGATIAASDSMMNFGVSPASLPHVIFSFGTAPE